MSRGVVRRLPFDAAGAPSSVEWHTIEGEQGYSVYAACLARLRLEDAEGLVPEAPPDITGYWCTRPLGHAADEVHVCHLRQPDGTPVALLVWGGE